MNHAKLTMTGIALGLAAAAAFPAAAQDRDSHFNGPYVQVFGGLAAQGDDSGSTLVFDNDGDGNYDDVVRNAAGTDVFTAGACNGQALGPRLSNGCRSDKDDVEYGARIGFDRRMSNFVVGALIEASKNEASDATTSFSTTPAFYTVQRELDYSVSARLRAGYTPGGGALFYVTGGGGLAKLNHSFQSNNGLNSYTENRDGKTVWGWQAGGGGEIMVTDKVSLGVEYLYNRYSDNKYNVSARRGTAAANHPFLLPSGGTNIKASGDKFAFHSLRAVVGFHF